MQSESTRVSRNEYLDYQTQIHPFPSHHGLPPLNQEPAAHRLARGDVSPQSLRDGDTDATSVSSSSSRSSRGRHSQRLSSRDTSLQRSSPVNRIEEYERSQLTRKKKSHGLAFQVIPSTGTSRSGISAGDFPNGRFALMFRRCKPCSFTCRGFDPHALPSGP